MAGLLAYNIIHNMLSFLIGWRAVKEKKYKRWKLFAQQRNCLKLTHYSPLSTFETHNTLYSLYIPHLHLLFRPLRCECVYGAIVHGTFMKHSCLYTEHFFTYTLMRQFSFLPSHTWRHCPWGFDEIIHVFIRITLLYIFRCAISLAPSLALLVINIV